MIDRRILRCNVTRHPSSAWVVWQLREAPNYLVFDCAANFSDEVIDAVKSFLWSPNTPAAAENLAC